MELTQEHFDQSVKGLATKSDLDGLATKKDLNNLSNQIDGLARMVTVGFDELEKKVDMRDGVKKLETEMKELRSALHLLKV